MGVSNLHQENYGCGYITELHMLYVQYVINVNFLRSELISGYPQNGVACEDSYATNSVYEYEVSTVNSNSNWCKLPQNAEYSLALIMT